MKNIVVRFMRLYSKWASVNKYRIALASFLFVFVASIFLFYKLGSNKGVSKKDVMELIVNLDTNDILRMDMYLFSGTLLNNFSKDTIVITDKTILQNISNILSDLKTFEDGSPVYEWKVNVHIYENKKYLDNIIFEIGKNIDGKSSINIIIIS